MLVPRALMTTLLVLPQRCSSWERIGGHVVMDEVCDPDEYTLATNHY